MKRWVIKAGSQSILEGGPLLIRAWMQQVETLRREHDVEVIWVTSGAIAQANDRIRKLNLLSRSKKIARLPTNRH